MWPFNRKVEHKKTTTGGFEMLLGGRPSASGLVISPEVAMSNATVFSCVRIISETVGQIPTHTFNRLADGAVERDRVSPLARIFARRPNEWTTIYEFKRDMQADVLLRGNAYALILRDGQGVPRMLRQLSADAVMVKEDQFTGEPSYQITVNGGGTKIFSFKDVLHLQALDAKSVVDRAREAIGMALAQERVLNKSLAKGQRPSGFLAFDNPMSDESIDRAVRQVAKVGEESGIFILDGGAAFKTISMSNLDSQFLEMRRHQIAEIARAFRVPLHMLQELERTTHQNAEQLGRQFLQFTMLPHLTMWQQEIALKLGPEDGSTYVEFLTDDLARADLAARMEAHAKAVANGILNPNEIRAIENRAPYAGGDEFLRPMNMEGAADATE